MVFLSPRSGRQHKAWGASPRYDRKKHFEPTLVGDSAAARSAGLGGLIVLDPGACAPGFMLPPAPRAWAGLFVLDPGACAPGFMLPPASRAENQT
jgi:hypothetical protein